MRDLIFTLFDNAFDTQSKPSARPWSGWLELLGRHAVRGSPADTESKERLDRAKNGPAVILGEIPAGKSRKGSNVRAAHALALDIEGRADSDIEQALAALLDYEYLIYTTHKHGSAVAGSAARLRVVLPLAEPIAPADYASAWAGLNAMVGGINDPQTRDIGRLHFLPSTFDAELAWTLRNPGRWIGLADLPDIEAPAPAASVFPRVSIVELEKLMHSMISLPHAHDLKDELKAVAKGEPFAAEGERHNKILSITYWLATKHDALDRDALQRIFGKSLAAMAEESTTAPTLDEVETAYRGALEMLAENEREKQKEREQKARDMQVEKGAPGQGPYTDDDLERIARSNGWTVAELKDRWIVQRDGAGWILSQTGEYIGPYIRDDLPLAVSKHLARATTVRLLEVTRTGAKYRPISDVIREAGSLADRIISDLTAQRTRFEPRTRTVYEAITPIRDLEPEFDEEIDGWLRVMTGPHYTKVVDWIACCSDLNKLLCAIYFDGAPSSGKTLFAHGLAKLWTEGPPGDIEAVLSDFNEEICRCPLLLADEEIPRKRNQTVTTTLRSMLSTMSRTLKRKYRPTSDIRGAVRLILAANNEFLLDSRDVSSAQDLEAIAQRFLYVVVPQEAAELLEGISRARKNEWLEEGIAKHALWLAANHEVEHPGKRFWVEGDVSQMHRLLMTSSRWNSLACEWLVKYLLNPQPFDAMGSGLIRRIDGALLVNDQAVVDHWDLYLPKVKQDPETAKIGAALRTISKTSRRVQKRWQGNRLRYREIDVDHLISWSDRFNIGDADTLVRRLGGQGENVADIDQVPSTEKDIDPETGQVIY